MRSIDTSLALVATLALTTGCVLKSKVGTDDGTGGSGGGGGQTTASASTASSSSSGVTSSTATSSSTGAGGASSSSSTSSSSSGMMGLPGCAACEVIGSARIPTRIVLDTPRVYLLDGGSVTSVAKTGGSQATLGTLPFGGGSEGLAIDASGLYLGDLFTQPTNMPGVVKVDFQGGPFATLATATDSLYVTGVGVSQSSVVWGAYWTIMGTQWVGEVRVAPLGGGPSKVIYSGTSVFEVAADATDAYFTTQDLGQMNVTGGVFKVPLAGGATVTMSPEVALSLALGDKDVFWSGSDLKQAPKAGGAPIVLKAGGFGYVAVDGTDVFLASFDGASKMEHIVKIPHGGGKETVIADIDLGVHGAGPIAVDGTHLYGTFNGTFTNGSYANDGGVFRIGK